MRLIFDKESELKNVWADKLREAAEICLANEGITKYSEISVSFVSEEEIRKLNREYRENDSVTDVLSFPMFEAGELAAMSARVASEREALGDTGEDGFYMPLGDVVICEEQARKQAEEYGHSYEREVVYLFVHSDLHLLGYDHMNEEEKSVMRAQEEIVMREMNLTRSALVSGNSAEFASADTGGGYAGKESGKTQAEEKIFMPFAAAGKSKKDMYEALIKIAEKQLVYSYAPFSKFNVGAALLTKDDFVCTGVNIENSSFGATICAERTAFAKAISCGVREFKAIAVVSSAGSAWPCGICRQFMKEFCDDDFEIISYDEKGKIKSYKMTEILPEGFRL